MDWFYYVTYLLWDKNDEELRDCLLRLAEKKNKGGGGGGRRGGGERRTEVEEGKEMMEGKRREGRRRERIGREEEGREEKGKDRRRRGSGEGKGGEVSYLISLFSTVLCTLNSLFYIQGKS